MTAVLAKDDYVSEGLGYLREGLKNRPNLQSLLTAFLDHAQDFENVLESLGSGLLLQNAQGVVLDNYGDLVGVPRNGQSDDSYKLFIQAAIAANHGNATLQTTILLAQKLFDTQAVFVRHPLAMSAQNGVSNAFVGFQIGTPGIAQNLWPIAEKLLAQNIGAAVASEPLTIFNSQKSFAFAPSQAGAEPWVGGFGDVNDATVGAPMAGIVS